MSSSTSSKRKRRLTHLTFSDLTHPNFEELSRQFPHSFGVAWQGVRERQRQDGGSFASNVTDEFSRATTRALLHSFFGLSLPHIPSLCPPVPNRYFLVQWIQQTLLSTLPSSESADRRCGIDIGTGATCIYPLLFCAPHNQILESDNDDNDTTTSSSKTQWTWFASEIDPTSVAMAQKNVVANHLESKIKVIQVQPTTAQQQQQQQEQHAGPLLQLLQAATQPVSNQKVDVVLTNPPFHDPSAAQVTQPTRQGDHRPKTNLTCTEASYPGGEVAFVTDMLADAFLLRYNHEAFQSTWYACMLGKKTSFQQLHHLLDYLLGPGSIPSTQFGPGNLTRWFLAWTLQRPTIRSPLAKSTRPSFAVTLSPQDGDYNSDNNSSVPAIVAQRIATYFREQRNYSLAIATTQQSPHGVVVSVREETPTPVEWDDKKLPPAVWQVLQKDRIRFLDTRPAEGHFLLDISVDDNNSTGGGRVQVTAYSHSTWGCKAVETLTNTNKFKAEIGRTSRKWRRIQQPRQQQQQPMDES
ncbi:U6 small nuclear RNA (adenine-(43)-N(6))-methyltransferase [Seminavis robusta]|uniref:U6 small nuclear RNA (Adenine-(43)-N(6))-methyltransferase n=1 Tax=Seminavis robusta TaxID=568900 RepID=A0A9N8HJG9_9STRA|nr:U6 small nuclear RNA (adenine-(43)-N(6))-methyltransferase [Seminavis robusta]|eukprot:Sro765_g199210.1 U6 small nuclear RNA (adenine-(43)-N(6))-methyltransferase (524) ;mRNA; r:28093-29664